MSTFCSGTGSPPAFTPSELTDQFPGGIMQSISTPTVPDPSTGIVSDIWIQSQLTQLENVGIIPKPTALSLVPSTPYTAPGKTPGPLADYIAKDRDLQDAIKQEYCYYEARYFFAVNAFLDAISESSMEGKAVDVNAKLITVKNLNITLNVFTQIVNAISKTRHSKNVQFQADINSINGNLQNRQKLLQEQSAILNKESASVDLYKRMVAYTQEKNNANQNLLTLYGVLNIVAIGCIVYIAKS